MKKIKSFFFALLTIVSMILFTACPKTPTTPPAPVVPVDDATQVMASVVGIVTDETNIPIQGAVVTSGTATATTDAFGSFSFNNISLSKNNGSVSVTKVGYFKGIRSFISTAGKQHQIKLQLMKKGLPLTVSGATGGVITSNGGATINFPAAAFVTNGGAPFTGTVNVYSCWIDPTASNLPFVIPGDLRGVNTNGTESVLETYGMVGAELEDASGNKLKIAPGVNATVNFPIPASLMATAPSTIPLWHFDEATARWREDGSATKSGSNYTALINKFSFWNVDVPSNFIHLDFTLVTSNGTSNLPLPSTSIRIKKVSNGQSATGITNNTGFVTGLVPINEALVLEVLSFCNVVVYSQNIPASSSNISLGNVNFPPGQISFFNGRVVDCSGNAVTNGKFYLMPVGGIRVEAPLDATGNFVIASPSCNSSTFNYQAYDNTNNSFSSLQSNWGGSGQYSLGNINTCASLNTEYVKFASGMFPNFFSDDYTIGITANTTPITGFPGYTFKTEVFAKNNGANGNSVIFNLLHNNSITGSGKLNQLQIYPSTNTMGPTPSNPTLVPSTSSVPTYTQFGTTIGSYIEGSMSVNVSPNVQLPFPSLNSWASSQMSFKVRRTN